MAAHAQSALTGPRKVAILLAALGEEAASLVLRQLTEREVEAVAGELAILEPVQPEVARQVLQEITDIGDAPAPVSAGGDYARHVVLRAFGEENGHQVLTRVPALNKRTSVQLEGLRMAEPKLLAMLLQEEHPQTTALILTQLEPEQASAVLSRLPDEIAADVVKRVAELKQFSPEMAVAVASILQQKLRSFGDQERQKFPGLQSAADIMTRLHTSRATPLLEALEQAQPNLAIGIRNLMFTFEDLLTVPETSLREWHAALDKKTLALALKGASVEVTNHILKGMSSRAAQMIREDLEALGPTRAREVTKAQEEAIAVARQLEAEGKLVLRVDGDDEFVV